MSFRNSNPKPLAYLIGDTGIVTECRLVALHPDHLVGFIPELAAQNVTIPCTLRLSLTNFSSTTKPGVTARIQGRSLGKDKFIIQIERTEDFWKSAVASQCNNRRQAFRVRCEEFGFDRPTTDLEITPRIEQGPLRVSGQIMNLSIGGCNIKVARSEVDALPEEGTQVVLVLEGACLEAPLRIAATIQRTFQHAKAPRIGLQFHTEDSPAWLRTEYQLQDYLIKRQRDHLRFRAA